MTNEHLIVGADLCVSLRMLSTNFFHPYVKYLTAGFLVMANEYLIVGADLCAYHYPQVGP